MNRNLSLQQKFAGYIVLNQLYIKSTLSEIRNLVQIQRYENMTSSIMIHLRCTSFQFYFTNFIPKIPIVTTDDMKSARSLMDGVQLQPGFCNSIFFRLL